MLPDFNEHGNLPPGIYCASLSEIEERFGRETEVRRVQMESLRWLFDLAHQAGVRRIVVDGSFVSKNPEPNDVDCLLLTPEGFPADPEAEEAILKGLPFLDIHLVDQEDFDYFVHRVFAEDKRLRGRGMIEVVL
jgi:hypothetical protein